MGNKFRGKRLWKVVVKWPDEEEREVLVRADEMEGGKPGEALFFWTKGLIVKGFGAQLWRRWEEVTSEPHVVTERQAGTWVCETCNRAWTPHVHTCPICGKRADGKK